MSWFSKELPNLPSSPSPSPEEVKGREITDKEAAEFSHDESFERVFISNLDQDRRDVSSKLLKAGTVVIRNPENPGELMEDVPEMRRAFIQHGFSFKFKKGRFASSEEKANMLFEGEVKDYLTEATQKASDFKEKMDTLDSVILTDRKREVGGRLLIEGNKVIVDPVYEELIMEDTPENRAKFIKNGGTWKPEK